MPEKFPRRLEVVRYGIVGSTPEGPIYTMELRFEGSNREPFDVVIDDETMAFVKALHEGRVLSERLSVDAMQARVEDAQRFLDEHGCHFVHNVSKKIVHVTGFGLEERTMQPELYYNEIGMLQRGKEITISRPLEEFKERFHRIASGGHHSSGKE